MSEHQQRFKAIIAQAASGEPLAFETAREAFSIMMSGDATQAQIAGLLMALRVRGETIDEITAGVTDMRERMIRVSAPESAIDTCGTGGDGKGTHNISTLAALILAGAGVTVAKHGNRGLSSRSGSSDVLSELGVNIDAPVPLIEQAIREAGIGFMMAPRHHGAMRHVAVPRVELGTRTIFNLLGPLANPAGVRRQITGVFAAEWVVPIAQVLGRLGSERAWVVHGADGMDELSTTGPTTVAEWRDGEVRTFELSPEQANLETVSIEALKGGDPAFNAEAIRSVLDGKTGPLRDAGLFAAAAGLIVADKASDLASAAELAAHAIDSGSAASALARLVQITNAPAPA